MAGQFPFRFYGRAPDDWAEGANEGHGFSVQFARPLADPELAALAELYERSLATGNARPGSRPWRWSERFASFYVGERWRSRGEHIGAVAGFLRAAHGSVVPVVDVVYQGARSGGGSWDAWSVRRSPPDPGPDDNTMSLCADYARGVDPGLPPPVELAAFEAGRRAAREAMGAEKVEDAIAGREPGKVGLARCIAPSEPPRADWPAEMLAAFDRPEIEHEDRGLERICFAGDHVDLGCVARPLAWVFAPNDRGVVEERDIAWLDRDGRRRTPDWPQGDRPGALLRRYYGVSLHPDGNLLAVPRDGGYNKGSAYIVDLGSGAVRVCTWSMPDITEKLHQVAWVDRGRRLAVLSNERLYVFDPRTEPMTELARTKAGFLAGYGQMAVAGDGALIALYSCWGAKALKILGLSRDALKILGEIAAPIWVEHVDGEGRFLFGAGGAHYELTHLDEVFGEHAESAGERAAREARASGRLSLLPAPADLPPPSETLGWPCAERTPTPSGSTRRASPSAR